MEVLFLDFDGVIVVGADGGEFSRPCIDHLKKLLSARPDLRIVVSSSWRGMGLDYVKDALHSHGIDSSKVVGIADQRRGVRGQQIQDWLNSNGGDSVPFVILDDKDDMGALLPHLVRTNAYVGLTEADVAKASSILDAAKGASVRPS